MEEKEEKEKQLEEVVNNDNDTKVRLEGRIISII
jgi:hypothetical protein